MLRNIFTTRKILSAIYKDALPFLHPKEPGGGGGGGAENARDLYNCKQLLND